MYFAHLCSFNSLSYQNWISHFHLVASVVLEKLDSYYIPGNTR